MYQKWELEFQKVNFFWEKRANTFQKPLRHGVTQPLPEHRSFYQRYQMYRQHPDWWTLCSSNGQQLTASLSLVGDSNLYSIFQTNTVFTFLLQLRERKLLRQCRDKNTVYIAALNPCLCGKMSHFHVFTQELDHRGKHPMEWSLYQMSNQIHHESHSGNS